MSEKLTQQDVERLLTDPSASARADTAAKIAREFSAGSLSARERSMAEEIFRTMIEDTEVLVRKALSDHLKESRDVPGDVVKALARDVDEVSLPVLQFSEVLSEDDLIEIVRGHDASKQDAIAQRKTLSRRLADTLVEEAESEAVVAHLVANEGADLAEKTLQKVVDKFGKSEAVQAPLVSRRKLPITVAERLVAMVADRFRDSLAARGDLPKNLIADLTTRGREKATLGLLVPGADERDVELLVATLYNNDRLTPTIILRALCMGDLPFFEVALARLARVPLINARALIHDERGLKAIYEKTGLPSNLLPAVKTAMAVVDDMDYDAGEHDRERFAQRLLERLLTQFDEGSLVGADDMEYLMGKFQKITDLT